jgi:hypothetical protein
MAEMLDLLRKLKTGLLYMGQQQLITKVSMNFDTDSVLKLLDIP